MPLPAVDAALTSAIDEPDDWQWLHAAGSIRGWVVAMTGRSIVGVRLCVAGRIFHGTYYLARPDVATVFPANPRAYRCGFTVDYELPAEGEQVFVLEALGEDGNWRVFATPAGRIVAESGHAARQDYDTWVGRFDTRALIETIRERARIESLAEKQRPLISVLMIVAKGGERWLGRAIDSVRAQTYPHWELCIAGETELADGLREIVNDYSRRDPRIRAVHGSRLDRRDSALNSALAFASGEFAILLGPADEISPQALAEFVFARAANPEIEFVYSDEDKIDERNRRFAPCFKPDWNPDLLRGYNYVHHLAVFRVARMRAIEGFRTGIERSEDWDLACRFVEGLEERRIHHIPKILYHVRAVRDRSTGADAAEGGDRQAAEKRVPGE